MARGEGDADATAFGGARDADVVARAAQRRLATVLDNAPQGVLVCTADEILYVNRALARIHGFAVPDEFRATGGYGQHVHPADRDLVMGRGKARMANQYAPQHYDFRFLRRDGSTGWMECNATAATWDGRPTSLTWLTDISARKRAEEALGRSERLFSKVFHDSPDIVTLTTVAEGRYVDVNEAFLKLSGRRREEVVGRTVFDLGIWIDQSLRGRILEKLRSDGDAREIVSFKLSKSGEARDYSVSGEIFQFEDEELLLTVCHDVTEQRRKEERRWRAQKLEALGTLAGGIAHDLNNALVPVLSLTKLTARRLPEGSREHRNLMTVVTASERARDLVKRILTFSREENPAAEAAAVDVTAVLREAMEFLRATLPATIKFELSLAPVAAVLGDASQLHRVVINLVTNAAQAIGTALGTIAVSLYSSRNAAAAGAREEWTCLAVADTGCGMEEGTLSRIFDPFFTTKGVGEGTGLGLSVVHGMASSPTMAAISASGARPAAARPSPSISRQSGSPRERPAEGRTPRPGRRPPAARRVSAAGSGKAAARRDRARAPASRSSPRARPPHSRRPRCARKSRRSRAA
jgi:PAS domain S-box-containing protein